MIAFRVSEHASHLELRFHHPEAGNAFGLPVAQELSRIVKEYRKWDRPVVVSSGHPTLFCSGGNLTDYNKLKSKSAGLKINRSIALQLKTFGEWRVVKLALIEGDVLGGGMEWLAHFDFRWSTPSVLFSFWQRRIGLAPGWGGGRAWSERSGEVRVRELMLEAEILSAPHARDLGLVDRVISAQKIHSKAESWCQRMQGESMSSLLRWSVRDEAKIFSKLWLAPDHRAALNRWKKSAK